MIKYFCDACGKEHKRLHTFQIPCHLFSKATELGYVDSEGNHVSGRMDSVGLCNACLNRVYSKAVTEFKTIVEETE